MDLLLPIMWQDHLTIYYFDKTRNVIVCYYFQFTHQVRRLLIAVKNAAAVLRRSTTQYTDSQTFSPFTPAALCFMEQKFFLLGFDQQIDLEILITIIFMGGVESRVNLHT